MSRQKSWTDYEHGFIQDHEDWPTSKIAEALGRTPGSVAQRRSAMRSGWVPKVEGWTKAEDDYLLATTHLTAREISTHLNRTEGAVRIRRQTLTKQGIAKQKFAGNFSPTAVGARPLLARTCPACGFLLQASWFSVSKGSTRNRICTRCRGGGGYKKQGSTEKSRRQTKERVARWQELTIPLASQSRQPWTESDFSILQDPDMTIFQKAIALRRTYLSVAGACHRNNFTSKVGLGDPERDQWIIDNPNAERFEEITASLAVEAKEIPEPADTPERSWDWDESDLAVSA